MASKRDRQKQLFRDGAPYIILVNIVVMLVAIFAVPSESKPYFLFAVFAIEAFMLGTAYLVV